MKFPIAGTSLILAASGLLLLAAPTQAQTLLLQLKAANYDPTTGIWAGSGGTTINATQIDAARRATLVTGATANGSDAVRFGGGVGAPVDGDFFNLSTAIPTGATSSYTAFVFLRTDITTAPKTIFGGGATTFQYRVDSLGRQQALKQESLALGFGTAMSAASFSSINVTVSTTGGSFRLDGAADGATSNVTNGFGNSISRIGARVNATDLELFQGDIAEIRIYSGILDEAQRIAVENEFAASYVALPEPSTWALMIGGVGMLLVLNRRRFSRTSELQALPKNS